MPRLTRTATAVATLALTTMVAACGSDSTSPKAVTASVEALHLDSLYTAAAAAAVTDSSYDSRVFLLAYLEAAAAYGAAPTTFSVNVSGATQKWTGYTFEVVTDAADSTFFTVMYNGANATDILFGDAVYSGGTLFGSSIALLANDTIPVDPTYSSTGMSNVSVSSATCSAVTGLSNHDIAADIGIGGSAWTCNPATFRATVVAAFDVPSGVPAGLASVSFTNSHVAGVRFFVTTGLSRIPVRDLLDRLRALHTRH